MEQTIAAAVVALLKAEGLVAPNGKKPVMTVNEAANYLDRSPASVRDMVRSGAIPRHVAKKLGGRIVLVRAELDRWLESSAGV